MVTKNSLIVLVLLVVAALPMSAATGILDFRVRDSFTHHPIQAVIKGEGPQSFSTPTNAKGNTRINLPVGDYLLQISASGYSELRTHYLVENGKTTVGGAFLDPQTLPEEESRAILDPLLRTDYTLLHEYVVDAKTGDPISGVKVSFINAAMNTQTDLNGHFVLLVPTPKPENPGGVGMDTLMYEKPGYKTLILRNLAVAPDEMGPSAVDMEKGTGALDRDATHNLMRKDSVSGPTPQPEISGQALSPQLYSWLGAKGSSFPVGPPRLQCQHRRASSFQTASRWVTTALYPIIRSFAQLGIQLSR